MHKVAQGILAAMLMGSAAVAGAQAPAAGTGSRPGAGAESTAPAKMAQAPAARFTPLDPTISVTGQLRPEDMAAAAAAGFKTVVNNRPDGEAPGQPTGAEIEAAARAAGLAYHAIPVRPGGVSAEQVDAMQTALAGAGGPVLAFCRTGTRSTMLWAAARSRAGDDPDVLAQKAAAAGYDLAPVRALLGRRE